MIALFRRYTTSFGVVFRPLYFVWGIAAATVLLYAADALARAGGGQNYVGGGSSSGGGGGGGDGLGALIYLMVLYPEIGVPVMIVVVVASIIKHRMGPDSTTARAVRRLEQLPPMGEPDLSDLKSRDPKFEETRFVERAKIVETQVQEAWARGDMTPVRSLVSDGLFRRFTTQLRLMRDQGIQNVMADHSILGAQIHAAASDTHYDTLHVAIRATVRDAEVDAALSYQAAVERAKKRPPQTYREIWSFFRKPGAKTLESDGVLEGRCPSCGGPVETGESNRCSHCEVLVNSGQHDWVLAEITQIEEWRPAATGMVTGQESLTDANPYFNRQAAEDRGSYLFWRWIEALVIGDPRPLSKVATPELKARVTEMVKAGRSALYKVAVGGVDLIACETDVNDRDRYHVRVLWSSARAPNDTPAHQANILSIGRASGLASKFDEGFSYAQCPNCHGPLRENDSPTCDYCGETLDAGETDWVLEAVIQPDELVLQGRENRTEAGEVAFIPDMGSLRERTILLMKMAAVVVADGKVTAQEMKLLKRAGKRWDVPFSAVKPILAGEAGKGLDLTMKPANPEAFLAGLVSAALVDGRIDKKEERLLMDISHNLGIKKSVAEGMMQKMSQAIIAGSA